MQSKKQSKSKRLLSIIVTVFMMLTLMSAFAIAYAETDDITIVGVTGLPEAEPPEEEPPAAEPPAEEEPEQEPEVTEPEENEMPEQAKEEEPEVELLEEELLEEELLEELIEEEMITVTITGFVISHNPKIATTIELLRDGIALYSTTIEAEEGRGQVTQAFSFTEVEAGEYSLKVTKKSHLSYTMMTLIVSEDDISYFEVTLKPGDLNSDGIIDMEDLYMLIDEYGKTGEIGLLADFNGDGIVDEEDLELLMKWLGETNTVIESIQKETD